MTIIKTYPLASSAILRLNAEKSYINVEPWYQRRGEVWTKEKKQLLIDSILNEFDIPKLYFHALLPSQKKQEDKDYDFAIIDGRQRLETIWGFMDDRFPLAEDFEYFADAEVKAAGLKYSELALKYPRLKIRFDSFSLPIVCVETDDIDLIEDMFSRLNEAVPLNAAEKRNAIGGPMAECIRQVAEHHFFSDRVRFLDKRYQHREVAARLLFIEYSSIFRNKIIDTKKPYLDDMVQKYRDGKAQQLPTVRSNTTTCLNNLDAAFISKDHLLRAQANISVFYLIMKQAAKNGEQSKFNRNLIATFFDEIAENRRKAEEDITQANFEMLEFDRMTQQGTNDAPSIRERVRILSDYLDISCDI
jgi:hypothetical protein